MRKQLRIAAALLAAFILTGFVFSCSNAGNKSYSDKSAAETHIVTEAETTSDLRAKAYPGQSSGG